ncbi:N-terminal EF-hand calcium-binding protein 1-like isoform X2 [Biomphalaria glabrata]|uniref:N-terminal EF-hand calcium-binding protein 1-like isoform X2 n=1 Tax=Biomphalaria glabrata TaxID=6526 RepID=A0A9W3AYF5_BIOGL|nr:N-terminal EF-hand calcium-binding protein 1-like isoform X2 [Biomphalaria glabrata]
MADVKTDHQVQGMTVFLDIFRRADKNDDGFISWEEFVSYFADGVMGKEELQNLFHEIDSHNTNNIDTVELCTYFSQHLNKEFEDMFGFMEKMNEKMSSAMHGTAQTYKDAERKEKFMMRFFLKEIRNQVLALQFQFDAALETLDAQAREERQDIHPVVAEDLKKSPASTIVPGHIARRAKRQVSSMSSGLEENGSLLNVQIDRLASLLDRVERKINFDGFRDEEIVTDSDDTILLVQREFFVLEDKLDDFVAQLRAYVDTTQGFRGCLNLSVREIKPNHSYIIYELWVSEEKYLHNCDSPSTKQLVSVTAELLKKPETVHSMMIPKSWWKRTF